MLGGAGREEEAEEEEDDDEDEELPPVEEEGILECCVGELGRGAVGGDFPAMSAAALRGGRELLTRGEGPVSERRLSVVGETMAGAVRGISAETTFERGDSGRGAGRAREGEVEDVEAAEEEDDDDDETRT